MKACFGSLNIFYNLHSHIIILIYCISLLWLIKNWGNTNNIYRTSEHIQISVSEAKHY